MKNLITYTFLVIIMLLILAACFDPFSGDKATITLQLIGRSDGRTAAWSVPPAGVLQDLSHKITLVGPTGTESRTIESGTRTAEFTVVLGRWEITVEASLDGEPFATGTTTVDVIAGRNRVPITMQPVEIQPVNTWKIELELLEVNFRSEKVGYDPETITVTIRNTGNQPTGALAIALSGTNADSFVLSVDPITNIEPSETATFTVTTEAGLSAGDYSAAITIIGDNGISANIDVSFTVTDEEPVNTWEIELDPLVVDFGSKEVGYAPETREVTITNIGNQPTGALAIALSGADADSFVLLGNTIRNIDPEGTATFTVTTEAGLLEGVYSATVTITGGNDISANINISFTVTAKDQSEITFNVTFTGGLLYREVPVQYTESIDRETARLSIDSGDFVRYEWRYDVTTILGSGQTLVLSAEVIGKLKDGPNWITIICYDNDGVPWSAEIILFVNDGEVVQITSEQEK